MSQKEKICLERGEVASQALGHPYLCTFATCHARILHYHREPFCFLYLPLRTTAKEPTLALLLFLTAQVWRGHALHPAAHAGCLPEMEDT